MQHFWGGAHFSSRYGLVYTKVILVVVVNFLSGLGGGSEYCPFFFLNVFFGCFLGSAKFDA